MAQDVKDEQVLIVGSSFESPFEAPPYHTRERGWDEERTTRDFDLRILDTPYGQVVAYSSQTVRFRFGSIRSDSECTIVPGVYQREESTVTGIRRVVVKPLPEGQRDPVERILRDHGYKGYVNFWPSQ